MITIEAGLAFLAAIALFIYSIKALTKETEIFVKEEVKNKLLKFRNFWVNIIAGFIITAILQSSSAFSVLVISLTASSAITLRQAFALIIGANIGSTMTAQIVSFKLFFIAPTLIIIGFLISFFRRFSILGRAIFMFGLVIFSLEYAQDIIKRNADLTQFFETKDTLLLFIISLVATIIVQSSGIITSIAVLLSSSGLISLYNSFFVIFGGNLGTVSTALIASRHSDKFGKTVAQFHVLFNVIVVLIGILFINQLYDIVSNISNDPGRFVANAHTLLNILAAFVMTFFSSHIERKLREINELPQQTIFEVKYLKAEKDVNRRIKNIRTQLLDYMNAIEEMAKEIRDGAEKQKNNEVIVNKYHAYSEFIYDEISYYIAKTSIKETDKKHAEMLAYLSKFSVLLKDLAKRLKNINDSMNFYHMDTTERYIIIESMETLMSWIRNIKKKPSKEEAKQIRDNLYKLADNYYKHVILRFEKEYKGSMGKVFIIIAQIEKLASEVPQIVYVMNKLKSI